MRSLPRSARRVSNRRFWIWVRCFVREERGESSLESLSDLARAEDQFEEHRHGGSQEGGDSLRRQHAMSENTETFLHGFEQGAPESQCEQRGVEKNYGQWEL